MTRGGEAAHGDEADPEIAEAASDHGVDLRGRPFIVTAVGRGARRSCVLHLVGGQRPLLEREEARRRMSLDLLVERRIVQRAELLRARAARVEATAARRVDRARDVPREHERGATSAEPRVRDRDGREERARVRMPRRRVQVARAGQLDELPEVHHGDAVGDVADDAQVVRDEDVRQPELRLEVLEQVEDLRLHRDVQGRDGLVGDDQLRVHGERLAIPIRWRWPPENSCGKRL